MKYYYYYYYYYYFYFYYYYHFIVLKKRREEASVPYWKKYESSILNLKSIFLYDSLKLRHQRDCFFTLKYCVQGPRKVWNFGGAKSVKAIYIFYQAKIAQDCRARCKPIKWDLGQSPRNLAIFGDGLKLIELPNENWNIGKISSKKAAYHLPISKRKKGKLTWLKVIGGAHVPSIH